MNKQELINELSSKGYLLSPKALDLLGDVSEIKIGVLGNMTLLSPEDLKKFVISWKKQDNIESSEQKADSMRAPPFQNQKMKNVKLINNYDKSPQKIVVKDFTDHFLSRFNFFEKVLRTRKELKNLTSISKLLKNSRSDTTSIIGMVSEKRITNNGNVVLTVEDKTAAIKVLISKRNKDLLEEAKDVVEDEVIGFSGSQGKDILFVNQLVWPDIPSNRPIKKTEDVVYAAFLGDVHFGSTLFLEDSFERLISWFEGKEGSESQKELAKQIKYVFITGDLIEGVGIYPNQEKDIILKNIEDQYNMAYEFLKRIPDDKSIIIMPGNHDVGRIAEPQFKIPEKYAKNLYSLPNVLMVSNPALVNIHASKTFEGFDFLLYHGYSLIYYAENIDSIREKGGQARPDLILKYLLKRRHLAPYHKSSLFVPDATLDPLIISTIPDFLVTGHIHRVSASQYKSVTLLNCSCWVEQSEFQEKNGVIPQPAKLPIINLKTRKIKVLNFDKTENEN